MKHTSFEDSLRALAGRDAPLGSARYEEKLRRSFAQLAEAPRTAFPVRRALVLCAVLLVLACSALAVAQRLGYLDFVGHYDEDLAGDLTGLYSEAVVQSGGRVGDLAEFTVRAASYDGEELLFLVEVQPLRDDVYLAEIDAGVETDEFGELWQPPEGKERMTFELSLRIFQDGVERVAGSYAARRVGDGFLVGVVATRQEEVEGKEDPLPVSVDCLAIPGDGEMEKSTLRFEVPVTAPERKRYETNLHLEAIRLLEVELAHTPLGLHTRFTYEPIQERYSAIYVLGEDGHVLPWGHAGMQVVKEGTPYWMRSDTWATGPEMPDTVRFWVEGTSEAVVLDTATGAMEKVPVTVDTGGHHLRQLVVLPVEGGSWK